MSIMIFPEGTRSSDGEISPFKDGAFRLAIDSGYPILPIAVAGTRHAIPKNTWLFGGKCRARIEVLPPVAVKGLGMEALDGLRERVRREIADAFARRGKSLPSSPDE